jgi:NitT/TauT family transport system substrate-binding protein
MRAKLIPVAAMAVLALTGPSVAKELVTMVHPTDPIFEASVWPILNNKVTSDKIDLTVAFTSIPAVIQSATTKQYDLVPMVSNALPRLVERGLPLKIMSTNQRYSFDGGSNLYVAASGPIKSPDDLKGKTIGVTSLNSSGVTAMRIILADGYKTNVALEGGDFKWVEMPLAVLQTALASGRVDGAILSNQFDYMAQSNKDLRPLFRKSLKSTLGVAVPTTVVIGYEDKLKARPEAFIEANRLLRASAEYVSAHPDEVFNAIAEKNKIDAGYLKWYYSHYAEVPYDLTKDDLVGIKAFWAAIAKLGAIKSIPKVEDLVWDKAKIK